MPVTPIDIPALAERLLALLQGTEDGVSIDWLMRGLKQSRFSVEKALYLLQGAGLTAPRYTVRWIDAAPTPNGNDDAQQRRVEVIIQP